MYFFKNVTQESVKCFRDHKCKRGVSSTSRTGYRAIGIRGNKITDMRVMEAILNLKSIYAWKEDLVWYTSQGSSRQIESESLVDNLLDSYGHP